MKTKLTALALAAATAVSFAPKTVHAGDRDAAAVFTGLIGGLIIASAIANSHDNDCDRPAAVVVAGNDCRHDYRYDAQPEGCWQDVSERVWIQGCWETRWDYGRRVSYFAPATTSCGPTASGCPTPGTAAVKSATVATAMIAMTPTIVMTAMIAAMATTAD